MSRAGLSNRDWLRRRRQRAREEELALRLRCPTCGAGPGVHCQTGDAFQLHQERRARALGVR